MPSIAEGRETLTAILLDADPAPGLWHFVDSGMADRFVPELPGLRLEQDPIHKHKDVLSHTIAVTAQTRAELRLRLAALFHDVGKPRTRRIDDEGVTFRHHEVVGAKMTNKRLGELDFEAAVVADVTDLVRLSGRFKGFAAGWSDSAVRRYARDAGHLLGLLNELVRADCTTRNERRRVELQEHVDVLEARITELAEEDRRNAERPVLDGAEVMARLGLRPGPDVGRAMRFLLALKRQEPDLDEAATAARLDDWWARSEGGPDR